MTKTRILVADDHELVRSGIRATLEGANNWAIVGEAANGREAIAKARELQPDVVIMDIAMPELSGLEATRHIHNELPHCKILILTVYNSEQVIQEVLGVGAQAYLLKSDAGSDLVNAIKSLLQGKPFFTPKVARMVLEGYLTLSHAGAANHSPGYLSPREKEVVQLLAHGRSNKEVASRLGISIKTVETHRAKLMRKLKLHSIAELVHFAIRNKLIEV